MVTIPPAAGFAKLGVCERPCFRRAQFPLTHTVSPVRDALNPLIGISTGRYPGVSRLGVL